LGSFNSEVLRIWSR